MVDDPTPIVDRGLGRADVHPPVLLHRVDVDDVAVEFRREVERQSGLTARGGTDHGDRGHHCRSHRAIV